MNNYSLVRKGVFRLVKNAKGLEFPEGNSKFALDRLVNMYSPHTALSILTLKVELCISKWESIEKNPDELISNLG